MSLTIMVLIAVAACFAVAGLTLAVYSSLPERFLNHANLGRYAGLAASARTSGSTNKAPTRLGSLQDQSV